MRLGCGSKQKKTGQQTPLLHADLWVEVADLELSKRGKAAKPVCRAVRRFVQTWSSPASHSGGIAGSLSEIKPPKLAVWLSS